MKRVMCVYFPWRAEERKLPVDTNRELTLLGSPYNTLRRLALWCQCFSPLTAVEGTDSLFLDITGCGPLFGGEAKLVERALQKLKQYGFSARGAIADTPGTAWAMAHYHGAAAVVIPPGGQRRSLGSLPVEALRLPSETVRLLREFDMNRVEHLQRLPRSVLPSRFGGEVLRRLDQALGDVAEPLNAELPGEVVEASWPFESPCADRKTIETALDYLLDPMLVKLRRRGLGIERLLCKLSSENRGLTPLGSPKTICLTVGLLHASASVDYLLGLIRLHLDRVRLPGEITAVAIHATHVVPLEFRQGRIFDDDRRAERWRRWPGLVETLSNRLGKEAILCPELRADAEPGLDYRYESWLEREVPSSASSIFSLREEVSPFIRPLSLQAHPAVVSMTALSTASEGWMTLRFAWNNAIYVVARCWGPERIETGWWRGEDVQRDYYLIETVGGERFWLFRIPTNASWFLHGIFC